MGDDSRTRVAVVGHRGTEGSIQMSDDFPTGAADRERAIQVLLDPFEQALSGTACDPGFGSGFSNIPNRVTIWDRSCSNWNDITAVCEEKHLTLPSTPTFPPGGSRRLCD